MRISDWSSDVCSSDLAALHRIDSLLGNARLCDDGAAQLLDLRRRDRQEGLTEPRRTRTGHVAAVSGDAGCHRDPYGRHAARDDDRQRSEEHTSELQSLMRISYAVFCLKKKKNKTTQQSTTPIIIGNLITNERYT